MNAILKVEGGVEIMKNKEWKTPELIILGRNRSEETVLTNNCKIVAATSGPSINAQGCGDAGTENCGSCQGRSGGS